MAKKKVNTVDAVKRRENSAALLVQAPPPIVEQGEDEEGPWIKFNFKGQPVTKVINALMSELNMEEAKAIEFYQWHMAQVRGQ
jgi:hypothetical protein